MSEIALEPCPFCGGEARELEFSEGVSCYQCGCCTPNDLAQEEAIAAWNHRQAAATISRLEEERDEAFRDIEDLQATLLHVQGVDVDLLQMLAHEKGERAYLQRQLNSMHEALVKAQNDAYFESDAQSAADANVIERSGETSTDNGISFVSWKSRAEAAESNNATLRERVRELEAIINETNERARDD